MAEAKKLTRAGIAALMHVTTARVDQLRRENILPHDGAMRPTLEAIVVYFRDKADLSAARRDYLLKKNQLLDAAIAREKGETITLAEAEQVTAEIDLRVRDKLLRIGNKVADRIFYLKDTSAIEAEIRREIEEALTELSRPVDYRRADSELARIATSP